MKIAFCTDAPLTDPASLRLSAHLAVHYGMAPEAALHALTLHAAQILGIDSRVGSLEVGKAADIVLLDGAIRSLSPVRSKPSSPQAKSYRRRTTMRCKLFPAINRCLSTVFVTALLGLAAAVCNAQNRDIAIRNARILSMQGAVIENGTVADPERQDQSIRRERRHTGGC